MWTCVCQEEKEALWMVKLSQNNFSSPDRDNYYFLIQSILWMECLWKFLISLGKMPSRCAKCPLPSELLVSRNLIIHTCCLFPVVDYSVLRICVMAAALWTWSHSLPPVQQMAFEALPCSEVQTFGSGTLLMPKSIRVENIQSILHVVPLWIRESGKQFRRKAARVLEY